MLVVNIIIIWRNNDKIHVYIIIHGQVITLSYYPYIKTTLMYRSFTQKFNYILKWIRKVQLTQSQYANTKIRISYFFFLIFKSIDYASMNKNLKILYESYNKQFSQNPFENGCQHFRAEQEKLKKYYKRTNPSSKMY